MAGVGGETLLGAGGESYHSGVVVSGCGNLTGFEIVTAVTISAVLTDFGTGGCFGLQPAAEGMAEGVRVRVHERIAAMAGVGGEPLLGAGGGGNSGGVSMLTVENIDLILLAVIPHDDINSNGSLRCHQITAVGRKQSIGLTGSQCLGNPLGIEEC